MKTAHYHLIAFLVIAAWGTTFAATMILLHNGLSPRDIFFYRFLVAYVAIWFFGPRRLFADNFKDEFLLMLAGITGGSVYFMAENTALEFTHASNVALLACTAPIFTIFLSRFLLKEKIEKNRNLLRGSILALAGVVLVTFNGRFLLQMNPMGDILGLLAAISWAFYIIVLKLLDGRYSMLFITRKVFFYGLLTLLPLFLHRPLNFNAFVLRQPIIFGNLLYLGLAASLICYFFWNIVVKRLGAVRASYYIYLAPVVTMATAVVILNETITFMAVAGAILILAGVALAEKQKTDKKQVLDPGS